MRYVYLLLLACMGSFAQAGGISVGNGGGVVYCPAKVESLRAHAELLDYYEARELRHIPFDLGAGELSVDDKIKIALDRLATRSPLWADQLRDGVKTFFDRSLFLSGFDLVDIPDSYHVALPSGCGVKQIVNRRTPIFPEDKEFTINKDLWDLLDNDSKAGLILHELIYKDFAADNSIRVRYFNSILATKRLPTMDMAAFRNLLIEVEAPFMEFPKNLWITQIKKSHLYPDGSLKDGYLWNKQSFKIDGSMHQFSSLVRFTPDGFLQDAIIDQDRFNFRDKNLLMRRWVSFFKDGSVRGCGVGAPVELWDSLLTVKCSEDQVKQGYSEFKLNDAGDIESAQACALVLKTPYRVLEVEKGEWNRNVDGTTGSLKSEGTYELGFRQKVNGIATYVSVPVFGTTKIDLKTGNILLANLAQTKSFNVADINVSFMAGSALAFHEEDGSVDYGVLANDQQLTLTDHTKKVFSAGTRVYLDRDGLVIQSSSSF